MKRPWFGILLSGMAIHANATGRLADVQVVDRETGSILPAYRSHGEYWVAGRPGARYSIVIQNHRGERLLAVTSVDGVNVISGETGAWGQSGYVFSPGERYEISGWRKSNSEIADFNFTAASNSYAERTGRPANVGVIGVALFLERRPEPPAVANYSEPSALSSNAPRDAAKAESADAMAGVSSAQRLAEAKPLASPASPTEKLGTGHGAREYSYVENTTFDRLSATPSEVIKIRYDSYANLVA